MEIRIYDCEFNFIGVIENHTSLLWHRTYNECGDFTLTVPITWQNINYLQLGNIVWVRDKIEAGIIESKEILQQVESDTMTIKGRFLEAYLGRRLINVAEYSGKTEIAMRALFGQIPSIPMVELGELNGYSEEISYQAIYKNMLEAEEKLAKSANFGFRMRPLFADKKIIFDIYKGVNHTYNQYDNEKVIFSEEYGNLSDVRVSENDQLYYNVITVGGKNQTDEMVYVTVGNTEAQGIERREAYLDATDVQAEEMTEEQFIETLKARGNSALGGRSKSNSFECVVIPNWNFIYGKDYDIGDIITVRKKDWGISENLRVSEVTEIYEHEIPNIEVILGTALPTKFTWE